MKSLFPMLVMAILASLQLGNVLGDVIDDIADEHTTNLNLLNMDEWQRLDYVIDMVNEIELKLKIIQDMTMRLNILEVFVYQTQAPVNVGLDEVDNWAKNLEYQQRLVDLSPFEGTR